MMKIGVINIVIVEEKNIKVKKIKVEGGWKKIGGR